MENEYINVPGGLELPKVEEVIFLNYLEEYLLNKEKENPNIKLGKIDLPGFTIFGIHEIILISKKFGFIERLVEQNKIDDSKVGNSDMLSVQYHDLVNDYKYEGLIMILSISEKPISDLCSFLKE